MNRMFKDNAIDIKDCKDDCYILKRCIIFKKYRFIHLCENMKSLHEKRAVKLSYERARLIIAYRNAYYRPIPSVGDLEKRNKEKLNRLKRLLININSIKQEEVPFNIHQSILNSNNAFSNNLEKKKCKLFKDSCIRMEYRNEVKNND